MRVCEKHWQQAVDTLVSQKSKTEYDLCEECLEELSAILGASPKAAPTAKRTTARRKK
jgi:hypothetical protein